MRITSEKVGAVVGTFLALRTELEGWIDAHDPRVQAALIESATSVAMGTDTRDMGLLAPPLVNPTITDLSAAHAPHCRCDMRPWCEDHGSATIDPNGRVCATHDHHLG